MANKQLTMSQLAALAKADAAKIEENTDRELKRFAQVGVGLVKREIQNMHAVDTSTMLNSTVAESTGANEISIGPTTDYAAYVALGTSRMPARPFHTVAAANLQKMVDQFNLGMEL